MRDLFGNPPDGSFLAWLADHGVWAALIIIGASAVWYTVHRLTETWMSRTLKRMEDNWLLGPLVKNEALFKWLDEIIVGLVIGLPGLYGLLVVLGVDTSLVSDRTSDWWSASLRPWLTDHGIPIALLVFFGWIARGVLARAMVQWLTKVVQRATQEEGETPDEAKKRAETLTGVMDGLVAVLIFLVVVMMVLLELNVPIGPLIGSLGLVGVAVGFGSQWLVRDLIAGAFIIGENQYRRGDVVQVAGVAGLVESINLRRTTLRDLDGKVHIIPNGEVRVASNFSRKWARVNIDVTVAYKHDLDYVMMVLDEVCERMSKEPYWSEVIMERPKVLGVNSFDASGVTIKVLGQTKPLKNWEVRRELLLRIKKRFDQEGIEIPFQHMTLYWGDDAHPAKGDAGSTGRAVALNERLRQNAAAAAERVLEARHERLTESAARTAEKLGKEFETIAAKGGVTAAASHDSKMLDQMKAQTTQVQAARAQARDSEKKLKDLEDED